MSSILSTDSELSDEIINEDTYDQYIKACNIMDILLIESDSTDDDDVSIIKQHDERWIENGI